MRILDEDSNRSLRTIILYLTRSEASEFRDSVDLLLADGKFRHEHISSSDHSREITVCLYDANDLEGFDERSIAIIESE
ncbi:MAG TPA: hypothetical protein VLA93_05870 [Pyrinomonadaceae bacterium]|nr:hypothetical protein [Pyrinomonadaceae bacterium]